MNSDIDTYIAQFPTAVQERLQVLRNEIKKLAPQAVETMSYGMPAYKVNGRPVAYFAAFSKHIGFYAIPSTHVAFAEKLAQYKHAKGSVQFPLDQPLPLDLIREMVNFNLQRQDR